MGRRLPGEPNACVVCGCYPCAWGLCTVCMRRWCPDGSRPPWVRAMLAMHRTAQRRRRNPVGCASSLEEVTGRYPWRGPLALPDLGVPGPGPLHIASRPRPSGRAYADMYGVSE